MAIGKRHIDGDKLIEKLEAEIPKIPGSLWRAMAERWLRRQPRTPRLASGQRAAEILGVQPPHLSRYKHRLNPVNVEGSRYPLYDEDEVKELRKELNAERAERKAPSK